MFTSMLLQKLICLLVYVAGCAH